MSLGETFKKIRNNKNLKQKFFLKKGLSQSMISYFENDSRKLEVENFIHILEKLNMSLEEFKLVQSNYILNEREEIIKRYYLLKVNNYETIQELIDILEKYLMENNDIMLEHILIICKGLSILSLSDNIEEARKIIQSVWSYYEKKDFWYLNELKIINSILFVFNSSNVLHIANLMLKNLSRYPDTIETINLKLNIRTNIVILMMEAREWNNAFKLLNENLNLFKLEMNYLFLVIHYNRIAICMYKLNIPEYNSYIEKANMLLELIEEQGFIDRLKKEYETWINK